MTIYHRIPFIYFAILFIYLFIYLSIHLLEIKTFCKNKKEEKRKEVVIMHISDRQRQGLCRQAGMSLPPAAYPTDASCPSRRLWTAGHAYEPPWSFNPTGISRWCQTLRAHTCSNNMIAALCAPPLPPPTLSLPNPLPLPRHESHLQTTTPPQSTIQQCHSTA